MLDDFLKLKRARLLQSFWQLEACLLEEAKASLIVALTVYVCVHALRECVTEGAGLALEDFRAGWAMRNRLMFLF